MMPELLEQLATSEVPPPPPDFDRAVHRRVNRVLVLSQWTELAVCALPFAVAHFAQALAGLLSLTFSGRYPDRSPREGSDRG